MKKEKVQKKHKKKHKKEKKEKRKIAMSITIPIIFSLLSLLIIAFFIVNIPLEPRYGMHTTNTTLTFQWLGFASKAFIDDNPEFSSPVIVEKNKTMVFKPGEYYWKTKMLSPTNKFTIDSEVAISVESDAEKNIKKIRNVGNIELLLEIFKNFVLTGQAVLNLNESFEVNILNETQNATQVIASQYDNETS